jgi:hypothetical protein
MKIKVRSGEKDLPVEFRLGSARDFQILTKWKSKASRRNDPLVLDALEYRSLAGKRWRSYSKSRRTVSSLRALKSAIARDANCEAVFIVVAGARWHSPSEILGFCFCRRTWCHHIIIDFAAAHPNAIRRAGGEVRGVGSAMLYALVCMARTLDIRLIWGEATLNSVEFYKKALEQPGLTDHFFIQGETFERCLRAFQALEISRKT